MTPEQHHDIADKYANHAAFIYGTSNEDPSEHGTAQMAALATLALAHALLSLREPPRPARFAPEPASSLRDPFTRQPTGPPRMPKMDERWDDLSSGDNADDEISPDADPDMDNVYSRRNVDDDDSLVGDVDYPIDDDPDEEPDEAP